MTHRPPAGARRARGHPTGDRVRRVTGRVVGVRADRVATEQDWLREIRGSTGPLRLVCFPHAGAGPAAYRQWARPLAPAVRVTAVQLPAREERIDEPGYRRMGPLLDDLVPVLARALVEPFAFFGHSMGALVAYEVTRRLRAMSGPQPVHLFVSGRAAPQTPERRAPVAGLADGDFAAAVLRYNGIPAQVAAEESLMRLLLPTLRADFELCETYRHAPGPPLECPLSAFGGLADDVWRSELVPWQERTSGRFRLRMLPGDHFFVATARDQVIRAVLDDLSGTG